MRCPTRSELPPTVGKTGWPWTEESEQLPDIAPHGSSSPRVSIVTPSYNQAQFIEETIRSVLLQGYPNLEYMIIDGGSTDGSLDIIRKYERWLAYWVSEPDRGQSHAINKGLRRATGDILGWLNSDDLYACNTLHHVGSAFASSRDLAMCYGDGIIVDECSRYVKTKSMVDYDKESLFRGTSMAQPAVFLHRRIVEELGPISEKLSYGLDAAYFIRVWHRFSSTQMQYLPKVLAYQREWSGAKTMANIWADELLRVFREFFEEYPDEYRGRRNLRKSAYAKAYRRQAIQQAQFGQRLRAQVSSIRAALLYPKLYDGFRQLSLLSLAIWLGEPRAAKVREAWRRIRTKLRGATRYEPTA